MIERTSIAVNAVNVQSFRHGLRDWALRRRQHFVIEYRSAEGQDQALPGLVSELARLKVDLIVTRGTPAALAAKSERAAIPVVNHRRRRSGGPAPRRQPAIRAETSPG